jgi:hypothetical protein
VLHEDHASSLDLPARALPNMCAHTHTRTRWESTRAQQQEWLHTHAHGYVT